MSLAPPDSRPHAQGCVDGLSGVRGCVVTDHTGAVLEAAGAVEESELVAAQGATLLRELHKLGEALHLGDARLVTIHESRLTRIIGMQGAAIACVELEPQHSPTDVEAHLTEHDWSSRFAPPASPPPPSPATPAGADRVAVFSGSLQLFTVPDLLEFLRASQRTGTLICSSAAGVGTVRLARGKITGAMSPATGGLAEHLTRTGVVAPEALEGLVAGDDRDPLPDAVVCRWALEQGLLDEAKLRGALIARVHDALGELVTWEDGRFVFDSSALVDAGVPGVELALDSQQLLLAMFSARDELERAP